MTQSIYVNRSGRATLPYSSTNGKRFVSSCVELIEHKRSHHKVLDLGAGSGTYSDLFRSRLPGEWTAVEIWEPYIEQFNLNQKYDKVCVTDALEFMSGKDYYDVIFLGDMLEHLTIEKANDLLMLLQNALTPDGVAFVSVPIGEYPQEAYLGNPYEEHLATWNQADIEAFNPKLMHYEGEIGVAVFGKLDISVAAYAIGKNEEKFITRMSSSLRNWGIFNLVYVDTGSTDNTVGLVSGFGFVNYAAFKPFRFDDARNLTLGLVSLREDYVLSIDADELVMSFDINDFQEKVHEYLILNGSLPDVINHAFQTVWDWETTGINITKHFHSRLHRRTGCRWVHPVHEKLVWAKEAKQMWYTPLLMEQRPDNSKDRSSYLDGLRIAVREDPNDWKLLCFLSDEVSNISFDESLGYLNQAFKLGDVDTAYVALKKGFLCDRYGRAEAGMHFDDAAFRNHSRELKVYQAEYETRKGNIGYATRLWAEAKAITNETQGYLRREDCWNGSLPQLA